MSSKIPLIPCDRVLRSAGRNQKKIEAPRRSERQTNRKLDGQPKPGPSNSVPAAEKQIAVTVRKPKIGEVWKKLNLRNLTNTRKKKIIEFLKIFNDNPDKDVGSFGSKLWKESLIAHLKESKRSAPTVKDVTNWMIHTNFFEEAIGKILWNMGPIPLRARERFAENASSEEKIDLSNFPVDDDFSFRYEEVVSGKWGITRRRRDKNTEVSEERGDVHGEEMEVEDSSDEDDSANGDETMDQEGGIIDDKDDQSMEQEVEVNNDDDNNSVSEDETMDQDLKISDDDDDDVDKALAKYMGDWKDFEGGSIAEQEPLVPAQPSTSKAAECPSELITISLKGLIGTGPVSNTLSDFHQTLSSAEDSQTVGSFSETVLNISSDSENVSDKVNLFKENEEFFEDFSEDESLSEENNEDFLDDKTLYEEIEDFLDDKSLYKEIDPDAPTGSFVASIPLPSPSAAVASTSQELETGMPAFAVNIVNYVSAEEVLENLVGDSQVILHAGNDDLEEACGSNQGLKNDLGMSQVYVNKIMMIAERNRANGSPVVDWEAALHCGSVLGMVLNGEL